MLNTAVIMGRLVATPELRTTPTGLSVTSFTVAVERRFAKRGEERQADYIDVVAWRQTAEFVTRFFKQGSMIAVQGSIQTRLYEDKNGGKRKAIEIVAENVSFCGSKAETNTGMRDEFVPDRVEPVAAFSNVDVDDFKEIPTEDELPF